MPPDQRLIDNLASKSEFVVKRADLLALGATADWISGRVSSGRWQRLLPGVYATFTGTPSWRVKVRAALMYAGDGAALSHSTAQHHWFDGAAGPTIELSVPTRRRVVSQPWVVIHHRPRMPETTRLRTPITTAAETVLDLIARLDDVDDVVGLLTTAARKDVDSKDVLAALGRRVRLRHRGLIVDVLADVDAGVESPLELRYHRDVEVAHGLPQATLQVREKVDEKWIRADCRYIEFRLRVELDGQLAHPDGRTDDDTWRDNAVLLASDELTLRYRWVHIAVVPCRTASQVADGLRRGGWTGSPRRCGPDCSIEL